MATRTSDPPHTADLVDAPSSNGHHPDQPASSGDELAEAQTIGHILGGRLDPTTIPTDYFATPRHRYVHEAAITAATTGAGTGPVAVLHQLQTNGHLRQAGGGTDLPQLYADATGDPQHWLAILHREAHRRRLLTASRRATQQLEHGTDVDTVTRAYWDALTEIGDTPRLTTHTRLLDSGAWIYDTPDTIQALWGHGNDILWARGESLLICGPSGVGKTTLAQQLLLARLGLRPAQLLDYPVQPARRALYLAMDRPAQARRSLARMTTDSMRAELTDRLVVWKGPLPGQLLTNTRLILDLAQDAGLIAGDLVVIDSIKDLAVGIAKDDVGAAVNIAIQELLAEDLDVLGLHHLRKNPSDQREKEPSSLDEIYGSTWITSGAGSVLSIWGQAGDPVVSLKHLKQPAEEVGPYRLAHDADTGTTTIEHEISIIDAVRNTGNHGMTAQGLATLLFPKENDQRNTKAEIAKARRRLERLHTEGILVPIDPEGGRGGRGQQTRYFLAVHTDTGEIP